MPADSRLSFEALSQLAQIQILHTFPPSSIFATRNRLLDISNQQKIERRRVVVHRDDNEPAVARYRKILWMMDVVTASIRGNQSEWLEGMFLPESLNLLHRHTDIIADISEDLER